MASCKPKIAKNSCTQAVSWDTETNSIRVCRRKLIIAECASHLLHCFKTYTCKQLSIGQTVIHVSLTNGGSGVMAASATASVRCGRGPT